MQFLGWQITCTMHGFDVAVNGQSARDIVTDACLEYPTRITHVPGLKERVVRKRLGKGKGQPECVEERQPQGLPAHIGAIGLPEPDDGQQRSGRSSDGGRPVG